MTTAEISRGLRRVTIGSCVALALATPHLQAKGNLRTRAEVIAHAKVWEATDVASKDVLLGPQGPGSFTPGETVHCDYVDKRLSGNSPKFECRLGKDDHVKVKYGGTNGEVYGELLATRLLWALGFGADWMYPVNVICHGCPDNLNGIVEHKGQGHDKGRDSRFDPAVVERKMPGAEWKVGGEEGWSWEELARFEPAPDGSTRAEREALTLLAVFLQHTDSKPQQQRIECLGQKKLTDDSGCQHPFLLINDLGLTFGRANKPNSADVGAVNLDGWRKTSVWNGPTGCVGNISRSFTGTLDRPKIGEEGRAMLARLLSALSDQQLTDLFDVARVRLRLRNPQEIDSGFGQTHEWVDAFKAKRAEIVDRRCS